MHHPEEENNGLVLCSNSAKINNVDDEVKTLRCKCSGHLFIMATMRCFYAASNGTLQGSKTWRRMIESDRAVSKTWSQLEWFTRNISEWWKLVWAKASQGSWNRWKTLLIWTNPQSNVSNHIQSILCSVYLDFTITTSHLNTSLVLPFVKCYAIRYSCVCPFSFCSE